MNKKSFGEKLTGSDGSTRKLQVESEDQVEDSTGLHVSSDFVPLMSCNRRCKEAIAAGQVMEARACSKLVGELGM